GQRGPAGGGGDADLRELHECRRDPRRPADLRVDAPARPDRPAHRRRGDDRVPRLPASRLHHRRDRPGRRGSHRGSAGPGM
ncbi:MAG: 3-oxoacyl-[acyl-carrier protein] reductase, partial [uncultured Pseudonocardia sp.]